MMAALKCLLDNSIICITLVLIYIDCLFQVEILLVLNMMNDFQLYPAHFGYEPRGLI